MANRRENVETVTNFLFLGSKITVDGDCSHEIRRQFLLGRKAMTNLDSVLKSKDITLLTKIRIIKSVILSVVTYDCESWTVKKAEHRRFDTFKLWCWRRLLRIPWTARRSNLSVKEINPNYSLERLMLKLQYFGYLIGRANSLEKTPMLEKLRAERKEGDKWLDDITDAMDINLGKLQEMVRDREAWCATVHGVMKSWS